MPPAEIEPSDDYMVSKWIMLTKFMLNRVEQHEVQRMVADVKDGMNYVVDDEGNIVESDLSPIDRDLETLSDRIVEKVEADQTPKQVIEEKLEEIKMSSALPATKGTQKKRNEKIELLEDILEEIE